MPTRTITVAASTQVVAIKEKKGGANGGKYTYLIDTLLYILTEDTSDALIPRAVPRVSALFDLDFFFGWGKKSLPLHPCFLSVLLLCA
jgi:hypothetical protein